MSIAPHDVLAFWHEAGYDRWFSRDDGFDARCRRDFLDAHFAAAQREHEHWMDTAEGALALVILLDQIPRNVFRNSGHAFATDSLARHYAARAIDRGDDVVVDPALRPFFYMPFEHSEAMADQERSVALTSTLGGESGASYLDYARRHRDVIARFGRFPHRNRVLGRDSTAEEREWLDAGGGF
ncbi:DUF924 domain-containing protein [Lysobacter sp. MMG2]|uniref:DUF924 family protein n=1 Tax=Lysobacter sp. MMG2 TaxID=2801338 RepID=UPI001C23701E|nr:DUF924 family protein [Lysobacter sp. MMG2]MBU8977481.1 DUF924 domain-containing protein [Lysobacter sp. MMG2]